MIRPVSEIDEIQNVFVLTDLPGQADRGLPELRLWKDSEEQIRHDAGKECTKEYPRNGSLYSLLL